jgi:hypothetical protein
MLEKLYSNARSERSEKGRKGLSELKRKMPNASGKGSYASPTSKHLSPQLRNLLARSLLPRLRRGKVESRILDRLTPPRPLPRPDQSKMQKRMPSRRNGKRRRLKRNVLSKLAEEGLYVP